MTTSTIAVRDIVLNVSIQGPEDGVPILLLHGFPETHEAWRAVIPRLGPGIRTIAPDLPGYGSSPAPDQDSPDSYAKRETAALLRDLMSLLGYERFAVVGHDRGGLVAFRMAMDHPGAVGHVGILDIIPTVDNWAALRGVGGVFAFHLYLLAQPTDLPERMLGRAPDEFFGHFIDTWTKVDGAIDDATRRRYLDACSRPEAIHAICQDYRASAFIDGEHDAADREAGRTLAMPTLALWQDPGDIELPFDPRAVWTSWSDDLTIGALDCGHFLPEERPEEVARGIRELIAR